jgi:hypothetical protein
LRLIPSLALLLNSRQCLLLKISIASSLIPTTLAAQGTHRSSSRAAKRLTNSRSATLVPFFLNFLLLYGSISSLLEDFYYIVPSNQKKEKD